MNECFSGIYSEISPDVANVVKMHICSSANGTDVTSHAAGRIEYNAKVANTCLRNSCRVTNSDAKVL